MRAVAITAFGGPETLERIELPIPVPGPGEVAIDVHFAGVGYLDTLLRGGAFPSLDLPLVPGVEVGGTIREIGEDVSGLSVGDLVVAFLNDFTQLNGPGGYAETAIAKSVVTLKLDAATDLSAATAALANGTTALMGLEVGELKPDDTMLLPGAAGGVAGLAAQIARHMGVRRIIGVASTPEKRAVALKQGCTDAIPPDQIDGEIARLTEGRGVDLAFDTVGGQMRTAAFNGLGPFGRLVIVGNASGEDVALSGDEAWRGAKSVRGLSVGLVKRLQPERVRDALSRVIDLVRTGALQQQVIVFPLSDAAEAHRRIEAREAVGKLLLETRR